MIEIGVCRHFLHTCRRQGCCVARTRPLGRGHVMGRACTRRHLFAPNGTPHVRRLLRGLPSMAPGSHPLSEDQMRRTWALVDILTSLKRRANHSPLTAELILRKFDALSLPALNTLSILIDHTTAGQHRRLSPRQLCGMSHAVACHMLWVGWGVSVRSLSVDNLRGGSGIY